MFLKGIEMENFKSFGRKITVPFKKGYTCITGPNGSGKSNISDSILFVLGPKSAKAMRAGRLSDLIFNGGKSRKPATYTKVTLIFDNTDHIIPVEAEEVRLTRLVKLAPKSPGDYYSYFYVNGKSSSLQEFDSLLAHARISAEGYNLVQQGDVTRVVEMGKIDRRRILDSIAGITSYDDDIATAEKKRLEVEANVETIGTVVDEVDKRVKQLEKDKGDAEKYRDIKDRYDLAKSQLLFKRKESFEEQMGSGQNLIKTYQEEQVQLQDSLQKMKREHIDLSHKVDELETKLADLKGEDAKELKAKIDELKLNYFKATDGVDKALQANKDLKLEKGTSKQDLAKVLKELDGVRKVLEKVEEENKSAASKKAGKEKELKDQEDMITRTDSKAFSIQRDIVVKRKEIDGKEAEKREVVLEKDRLDDKLNRMKMDLAQIEENVKRKDFELKDISFSLKEIKKDETVATRETMGLTVKYETARDKFRALSNEAVQLEDRIRNLKRDYEYKKAEAQAAQDVQKGYTRAVDAILDMRDKGALLGIHGTIAELGHVKDKYEDALTVAAGPRMQSIVVDDDETAAKCIAHLKKNNLGRATFLPLNKMIAGRPAGKALLSVKDRDSLGFAMDLVSFKDDYKAAFWFVFGDTLVVKDLNAGRRLMGGIRIVTLDGELLEKSGAMIGGNVTQSMKFGEQATPTDLNKISKDLRAAIEAADRVSKSLQQSRAEMDAVETDLKSKGTKDIGSVAQVKDLEFKFNEYKAAKDTLKAQRESIAKEIDQAEQDLEKAKRHIVEVDVALEALMAERDERTKTLLKATPQETQKKIKGLRDEIDALANQIRDYTVTLDTSKAKAQVLTERKADLEKRLKEIDELMLANEKAAKDLKAEAAKHKDELQALTSMETKSDEEWNRSSKEVQDAYKRKADLESWIERDQGKLDTKDDLILQQKDKIRAADEAMAEILEEINHLDRKIEGKLPSLNDLNETVRECEKRMEGLGNINMKALEDFEKEGSRLKEMKQEIDALKTQRGDLMKVVEELNGKKKVGLMKVFTAINENFKQIFAVLSKEGEAELLLENPESPFEGGLIIKARPKDKKVLRLESLSGGEKSLTALALIFAIQQYQPSPFYLLDEVDMFLDSINAGEVAKMVKWNSETAQFIQITLRQVTLNHSETRYGVTMQGSGISEVLCDMSLDEIKVRGLADDGAARKAKGMPVPAPQPVKEEQEQPPNVTDEGDPTKAQ